MAREVPLTFENFGDFSSDPTERAYQWASVAGRSLRNLANLLTNNRQLASRKLERATKLFEEMVVGFNCRRGNRLAPFAALYAGPVDFFSRPYASYHEAMGSVFDSFLVNIRDNWPASLELIEELFCLALDCAATEAANRLKWLETACDQEHQKLIAKTPNAKAPRGNDDLLDRVLDVLKPQGARIVKFLWSRNHSSSYESLEAICWDGPQEADTIHKALKRIQDDLNAHADLGVSIEISHAKRRVKINRP